MVRVVHNFSRDLKGDIYESVKIKIASVMYIENHDYYLLNWDRFSRTTMYYYMWTRFPMWNADFFFDARIPLVSL